MTTALMKTGLLLGIAIVLGGGELWAQQTAGLSGNWDQSAAQYQSAPVATQYDAAEVPMDVVPDGYADSGPPVDIQDGGVVASGGYPLPQYFGAPPWLRTNPANVPTAPPGNQVNPWTAPYADHYPLLGLYAFTEVATWRDFGNGDSSNNNGVAEGLNLGVPLPYLSEWGFGAQLGFSYGDYNFSGRRNDAANNNEVEQQWFVTGGFYRRADADRRVSMGCVFDLMMNDNFGVFNAPPTMGQFRFQLGYAIGYFNEIGVWGTVEALSDTVQLSANHQSALNPAYLSGTFMPVSMLNLYLKHKFGLGGAEGTLWVGVPKQSVLTDPGIIPGVAGGFGSNFGILTLGSSLNVPLTDSLAFNANMTYLQPDVNTGFTQTKDTWNISVGLAFYPGRAARSSTIAGRSSMPLMPVANNGTFLVNTNRTL
ncbi:MAG TPA: DUF6666 family protein [Pirellulales bacterium]|nr:DUF6666 family protein [Pirellulales bacterium]